MPQPQADKEPAASGFRTRDLDIAGAYSDLLRQTLESFDWSPVHALAARTWELWRRGGRLFLCGNGGSAASAAHLANDLIYGVAPEARGVRAECLCVNPSVVTCLANDTGYANVFALQLRTQASPGDGLIVLSGSGSSPNILAAIAEARRLGVWTCGILGYSGGQACSAVDLPIHFPIDDMEIAEDLQMVVGHLLKRMLRQRQASESTS